MLENQLETTVLLRISEGVNTFYTLTKKAKVGSNEGVLSTLKRLQKKGFILMSFYEINTLISLIIGNVG